MTWHLTLKEQMASQYSEDQDKDVCFHPAFFNIVLGVPRQAIRQKKWGTQTGKEETELTLFSDEAIQNVTFNFIRVFKAAA